MQYVKIVQILQEEKYSPKISSNILHEANCDIKLFKIYSSEDAIRYGIESQH